MQIKEQTTPPWLHTDGWDIILASQSPRRQELLRGLGLPFRLMLLPNIDESYPKEMPVTEVASYLSRKKAKAYQHLLGERSIVITADTIVLIQEDILGKPRDENEAEAMLRRLQGRSHQVITGLSLCSKNRLETWQDVAQVHFNTLTDEEIRYYVKQYAPLDKAGAYGIQEWIGYRAVRGIEGSFYTVMGLPTHLLAEALVDFLKYP